MSTISTNFKRSQSLTYESINPLVSNLLLNNLKAVFDNKIVRELSSLKGRTTFIDKEEPINRRMDFFSNEKGKHIGIIYCTYTRYYFYAVKFSRDLLEICFIQSNQSGEALFGNLLHPLLIEEQQVRPFR